MTLDEIKNRLLSIQAGINRARQMANQLAKSRGKTIVNPPSAPKPVVPVGHTSSSSATTYQVPKRNVMPNLNTNTSIVDYLKSLGRPSSFSSRTQLARKYGISNYVGSASQNIQLLNLLKSVNRNKPTTSTSQSIPNTQTNQANQTVQTNQTNQTNQANPSVNQINSQNQQQIPQLNNENTQNVVQSYINKYLKPIDYSALAQQAKTIAEQTYQPIEDKLKDIITNIKSAYKKAQDDLLEKQKQENEELKGAYSVRGLLHSGVYQDALHKLQKQHVQEINDLIQKENQDITNASYEVASKKPTAINNILRVLTSELQEQNNRASVLLGSLLTNQLAEEREKKKEKQVATTTTVTDENGNQYLVLLDANGNEIKRIYIGKAETTTKAPTISGTTAFEDTTTGKTYDLGTVEGLKEFKKDHPNYTYEDLDAWMDKNVKGLDATTRRDLLERAGFEKATKRFLNEDYFRKLYNEDQLKTAAKNAGFSGFLGIVTQRDVDAFLKDLMNRVQQYRKAGYTDKEILKMMTK